MTASSRTVLQVITVEANSAPLKKKPDRLPWPRTAEDDGVVQLGIDVIDKEMDIRKIIGKWFFVRDFPMEDLMQEVFTTIIHKNTTRSAHDPRKSSFGHYVWMIGNHVCINIVNKKKRYDKEGESIYVARGGEDNRTILDVQEDTNAKMPDSEVTSEISGVQKNLWSCGMFEAARYISAVRTGASSDTIRRALTRGVKPVSNKDVRFIRSEIEQARIREKPKLPIYRFAHSLLSYDLQRDSSLKRSHKPTPQTASLSSFQHAIST